MYASSNASCSGLSVWVPAIFMYFRLVAYVYNIIPKRYDELNKKVSFDVHMQRGIQSLGNDITTIRCFKIDSEDVRDSRPHRLRVSQEPSHCVDPFVY